MISNILKNRLDRADTIIEVMFSIAVFSLVVVCGLSIMNRGLATSERALEISLVRQTIDSQAEALRFLNSSYIAAFKTGASTTQSQQWNSIKASTVDKVSDFGESCNLPSNAFILDTRTAKFVKLNPSTNYSQANTFSQINYDSLGAIKSEGVWIEAVSMNKVSGNGQANAGYIDFHIRACWDNPGGEAIKMTLGTIVRLYEPL